MQYELKGGAFPVVVCRLNSGESMITEKGSMVWMTPNMEMTTTGGGGIGKMFGRAFSGESMFQNRYTAIGAPGMIAFASSFPGCIRPFQIGPGQEIIAQKTAFLASTAVGGHAGKELYPAKERVPCLGGGGAAIDARQPKAGRGLFRRRRLHHAAAFRKRHCIPGI